MTVSVPPMPRKSPGKPPEQSVKIPADIVQMARSVVSVRGGSMADLIAKICRPVLLKTVREMQDRGEFIPKFPDE